MRYDMFYPQTKDFVFMDENTKTNPLSDLILHFPA